MHIWGGSMKIPEAFKKAIAETFYDKELELWTPGTIKDDEGCVVGTGKLEKITDFKGNFQFSTKEYIQQEYGKEIDAEAIITCDELQVQIGNIIVYDGQEYEIKSNVKSDSHITLLVKGNGLNG